MRHVVADVFGEIRLDRKLSRELGDGSVEVAVRFAEHVLGA
jgi:hypothetical protein